MQDFLAFKERKKESVDMAVVGGKRISQSESRRVKFWISTLHRTKTYPVEAREIGHTIINVLALNRIEFPHHPGPVDLILGVYYSYRHAKKEVRQGLPF